MSLSRPVKFPLLKLPWLCIKCVIHNSDLFDIIYFASISTRTRRIVQNSKYPLKEIDLSLGTYRKIKLGYTKERNGNMIIWYFMNGKYAYDDTFVLQKNSQPFRNCRGIESWRHYLRSYTDGDTPDALKIGIDFLIDVFGCTIKNLYVAGNKLSELFGLGINSAKVLHIHNAEAVNLTDLKNLLEIIKVTDEYVFFVPISEDFYCDPQIFKCRKLIFWWEGSANWVTLEILLQFDVPQLTFWSHRFSKGDIVSYVTHWFNSENRKLEYLQVGFNYSITIDDFEINHLHPMPFCKKQRNRCPFAKGWEETDISSGVDILRGDGLLATFFVESTLIFFYVWHKRFPDTV